MDSGKVSIIMPVKDGHDYIAQAIHSVFAQTYSNWELIIIDDGSTDDSYHIATSFLSDPRVKVLKNPKNLGAAKTLNTGIENATGEFFARLDCDDIWIDPEKLSMQVDFLNNNQSYSIVGTWAIAGYKPIEKVFSFHHPTLHQQIYSKMVLRNLFVSSSVMARLDLVKKTGGHRTEEQPSEDYGLALRLLNLGKGANLNFVGIWYRLNPNGVSIKTYYNQVRSAKILVRKLAPGYPKYYFSLVKWSLHSVLAKFVNPKSVIKLKNLLSSYNQK